MNFDIANDDKFITTNYANNHSGCVIADHSSEVLNYQNNVNLYDILFFQSEDISPDTTSHSSPVDVCYPNAVVSMPTVAVETDCR